MEVTLIVLFTSGIVECSSAIVGAHSSGLELETWEVALAWCSLLGILGFYIFQTILVARFYQRHAGDTWAPAEQPGSEDEVSDPIYRLLSKLRRCLRMKSKYLTRELGEFVQPEEDEAQPGKTERALWRAFSCGLTRLKKSERERPGDEMDMLTLWLGDSSGGARRGILYMVVQTWIQLTISLWVGLLYAHPWSPTSMGVRAQLMALCAFQSGACIWCVLGTANDKLEGCNSGAVYALECCASALLLTASFMAEAAAGDMEKVAAALALVEMAAQILQIGIMVPIVLTVYDALIVPVAQMFMKQDVSTVEACTTLLATCILLPLELARSFFGMCDTSFADLAAEMEDLGVELAANVADDGGADEAGADEATES